MSIVTAIDKRVVVKVEDEPELVLSGRYNPLQQTATYQSILGDLQFAIDSGDKEFSPAVKLLLREAIFLTLSYENQSYSSYHAKLASIKATYLALLNMEVKHPVAKTLQARYRKTYKDSFWNFLEEERLLAHIETTVDRIASDGNVNKNIYFVYKRILDFIFASILIILFSPLMGLVALFIVLDSPGSALFIQERVGTRRKTRGGITTWEIRTFRVYKFRSMRKNADQSLHQIHIEKWISGKLEVDDQGNLKTKARNTDPRITKIGHFIRKTSIDELPQLFNVWRGEMSLVGPRPVPTYEVAQYTEADRERLASPPGMTGLWQIKGRGHVSFKEQIQMDVDYIHQQSLWTDIKILLLTVPAVLVRRGAK